MTLLGKDYERLEDGLNEQRRPILKKSKSPKHLLIQLQHLTGRSGESFDDPFDSMYL